MIPPLARLELHGVVRQRWFAAALALALGLVGFFTVVAARESAVLGFTGFGKVMGGVVQASLLILPLVALLATSQAIPTARREGVLEFYLSQPVTRLRCFLDLILPRVAAVVLPLAAAVLALGVAAWGMGQPVSFDLEASFLVLLMGQGFCFAALGAWIGAAARSPEQALLWAVVVWITCAIGVDFVLLGLLLRWELPAQAIFALAGLNPMQAGRIGILAAIDAELGVLGPVGTWATVTLGSTLTQAIGLAQAWIVGGLAFARALRVFQSRDAL